MKAMYSSKTITVGIHDLIGEMTDRERLEFAEHVSCYENVIDFVAQQIAFGCTENGYFGSKEAAGAEPRTALGKARRMIAKESGEVARKEIEALEWSLSSLQKAHDNLLARQYDNRRPEY